ncbi:hypothetical protein CDD81_4987 [Ophiocordyceps australis]|uniref:U3 small nucleolar RNA-associated protein 25 n=1 Tax=Ophiocordyceps australis TaxID=1399860 RepID=A0A2C5YA30_9HYPO|nr:hypothetical protein CDD81_4987 [Ophiocordyceps australis]
MAPQGSRGASRGKGFRGRGARRGARGTSRFGPTRRFDSDRLADKDDVPDSEPDDGSLDETHRTLSDVESDDDDDDSSSRPYMTLLRSFNDSGPAQVKRRKIRHEPAQETSSSPLPAEAGPEEPIDVDEVEQDEQEQALDADEQLLGNSDSDSDEDSGDPFDVHFARPDETRVTRAIQAIKKEKWSSKQMLFQSLRATISVPESEVNYNAPKPVTSLEGINLKAKLKETTRKRLAGLSGSQKALVPFMMDYQDVMFCLRTVQNSEELRQSVCLHALNHVFKTRDRVIKDTYKLSKAGEDAGLELRDQGFTRPKVLFLLPTRNSCARLMNTIRDLCEPDQQENRKRFDDSYVEKNSSFRQDRPADFRHLFEGNDDDMFRIGVKFTRKTIKYFAQFYNSDMLFASPLGLRMAIGSEEDKKKLDSDFLSSIELVVMDQADALLMQNWEHVEYIFEHLNQQPKEAHDCDFSRVRNWYLEDWAKFFRQTVILSAFNTPELAEVQRLHCHNWAGKIRLQPEYPGVIQQLEVKAKQTFSRFQSSAVDKDPDARFDYFVSAIVPMLVKRAKDATGTLLFVPSYLDFVRVRNYFANSLVMGNVTFGAISEYTDVSDASRTRSHFLSARHRVLLYTERAHHFRRYHLRGVQRVIFYGLPDNPIFYKEIAGGYLSLSEQDMKVEPGRGVVRVMFSKYDVMKLERIVGSPRVGKMIMERGDTFDFA